ncbi:MAG TPA: sensor histidine kinase [Trebonia sp.]|nr:sensor histidine kinase [Trebonia sp.]
MSRLRPPLRDTAIAAALTVIAVAAAYGEAHPTNPGAYFTGSHHLPHTPDAAFLLVVLAGAVLAWRHRYPLLVLVISTAAVVVFSLLGYVNGVALLLPAVALGTAAAMWPIRRSVAWAIATTLVLMGATAANNPLGATSGGFVIIPANMAVALFAGIAISNRRAYVDSLRERAEREARRQVDEERLRIARELHDVVAHTMATINVQASAATQLLRDRPEQAAESLAAIRAASKDGLRELRAILNVLRHADEPADPTRPVPGIARLDALAEGVRAAGLPVTVTVTVTGQARELPAVTDLAAFRIIQEALTNAVRHAGPATATVSVRYGAADLDVEITDTGHGGSPASESNGTGHGLRGMRERAAAAGGTIEIGPRPSGGFRVAARFPLDEANVTPTPQEAHR